MSTHFPYLLPTFTSLVGFGAFSIGIYSFFRPVSSATIYGIPIPLAERSSSKTPLPTIEPLALTASQQTHLSYVYAHGIRNLTMGTSVLALSAYYVRQAFDPAVRRCLGVVLLCGFLTPLGDAVITGRMAHDVGRRAGIVHALRSLVWLGAGLRCLL